MAGQIPPESRAPHTPGELPEAKIDGPGGFKITVPLPKWAVGFLAVLLILALVLSGAYWGYSKVSGRVLVPQEVLSDYKETAKHDVESDTTKESQEITFHDGVKVTVRHFHTDGCVEVLRTSQALITDKHWLLDLSRTLPPPNSAASYDEQETTPVQSASIFFTDGSFRLPTTIGNIFLYRSLLAEAPPRPLNSLALQSTPMQGPGCTGTCWNPHPGPFQAWNGAVNGCWLQVWRRWPEGCTHFQWFNTCQNFWDSNPDGSPRVTWTCCVH